MKMDSFKSSINIPSIFCLIALISLHAYEAVPTYRYHDCPNSTTFAPNSIFQSNLNFLLSSLSSNSEAGNGFYNTTVGPNTSSSVYGLFLCRGDVSTDVCRDCVTNATTEILRRCPVEKQSVIWYDECMLRYSDVFSFSTAQETPNALLRSRMNISDPDEFGILLGNTMNEVVMQAANDGSGKKFATKEANFTSAQTLYTLAQCTPDLSVSDCNRCLQTANSYLTGCSSAWQGARVLTSCNVWFELYPFYNLKVTQPPIAIAQTPEGDRYITAVKIVAPVTLSLVLFGIGYYFIRSRIKKKYNTVEEQSGNEITTVESLQFDLATIVAATNNFSMDSKLGEGGFGAVYKGTLQNGQEIAVKRLSKSSGQGAEEFKNEVVLVAKLQHRSLVRLLGFCLESHEKILVYEFVKNKSLDYFLFDEEKREILDWFKRYKIIGGIARGILYLHEDSRLRIIHRDLKPSNILLDDEMKAKISDFGMAKIFGVEQTQGNTSRIVGTYGYMSPEYAMHGQFSVKSDMYSFGVLVLEIISGKKNNTFFQSDVGEDLITNAWRNWKNETPMEFLDPILTDSCSRNEVIRCIQIGLLCVQEDPYERPTMASVVHMLNSDSSTLNVPQQPVFVFQTRSIGLESDQSTSKSLHSSVNEASFTEVYSR